MPPQITQIDDKPPCLPLSSLQPNQSHSCSVQRPNIHGVCEDSMLETDSQTDGSTHELMRQKTLCIRSVQSFLHFVITIDDSFHNSLYLSR